METGFQPGLFIILRDQTVNVDSLFDALHSCSSVHVNTTPSILDPYFFKKVTFVVTITHGSQDALFTRTPDGDFKSLNNNEASRIMEDYAIH